MNISNTLAALFLTLLITPSVEARSPRGISMIGAIHSVDVPSRKILIIQDGGPIRELTWTKWAKFLHTSAETLRSGMKVQVNRHNPLFGEDYITRVVLLCPSRDTGK